MAEAQQQSVTVSGAWLLKAFLLMVAAALFCAYATLCLLFYQGQWQLILHPSHTISTTPVARGLKFDDVHFDVTDTGVPQLNGWWVPADPSARWNTAVILYLHDGSGSLSDAVPTLAALHQLGINVFAFDYRGFGLSAPIHPDEGSMDTDANAAWNYLVQTRHISAQSIVLYGAGLGTVPAATLAAQVHPSALILDAPGETARTLIQRDSISRILPLSLLQKDRFDPAATLRTLTVPKLFVDRGKDSRTRQLFEDAAPPRESIDLRGDAIYAQTLSQFLERVLTGMPASRQDSAARP